MTTEGFTPQLSHSVRASNAARACALGIAARSWQREAIANALVAMRAALCEYVSELSDAQIAPPLISTINPPLWEAAHVAWFAEWFCVRGANANENGETIPKRASLWPESDAFLNSNTISHEARWRLPQLTRNTALSYLQASHEAVITALKRIDENDHRALAPFRWAMFHEAMHLEAFACTAQTLAWPAPPWLRNPQLFTSLRDSNPSNKSQLLLGQRGIFNTFQFDNEIGILPKLNGRLSNEAGLVTNAQFASFVDCGAYLSASGRAHPNHWRATRGGDWETREFDQWSPLASDAPMVHVNAVEAETYATWCYGRLPTEMELHSLFCDEENAWHGQVWEWSSTTFAPYRALEDFTPGLYREYSMPWFDGKHRVLRGGSVATLPIMHHPHYRNFFTPERSDVFAGFRVVPR